MNPNDYYRKLSASISDAEIRLIAALMSDYIGEENAVRLETLCKRASMDERKVRMILERLVKEYRYPVCAFSGKPGRYLARSYQEALPAKLELLSRAEETKARALAYDRCAYPPEEVGEPDFVQPFLVDIPEPEPVPYWERWS
jgi:hypothetical protein